MSASAAAAPVPTAARSARLDDYLFIACGLAWSAAVIHVGAAVQHVQEAALYAAFFAVLAPVQFIWGIALYRRRSRTLLTAGAIASLMVVALWIVSRTSGLPVGPEPWHPEPVGFIDALATADEIALALVVLVHLRPSRGRKLARGFRILVGAVGLVLILVSSLALAGPFHAH
jgi:hypothetical protein